MAASAPPGLPGPPQPPLRLWLPVPSLGLSLVCTAAGCENDLTSTSSTPRAGTQSRGTPPPPHAPPYFPNPHAADPRAPAQTRVVDHLSGSSKKRLLGNDSEAGVVRFQELRSRNALEESRTSQPRPALTQQAIARREKRPMGSPTSGPGLRERSWACFHTVPTSLSVLKTPGQRAAPPGGGKTESPPQTQWISQAQPGTLGQPC